MHQSICKIRTLGQEKASAEIRGEFFRTNFAGDFFCRFFGAIFLEKQEENPPQNPRQNSNLNLGVSRPKSTLRVSGLEKLMEINERTCRKRAEYCFESAVSEERTY